MSGNKYLAFRGVIKDNKKIRMDLSKKKLPSSTLLASQFYFEQSSDLMKAVV